MAASKEWKEWHLTSSGWVGGSEKTDFQSRENIEPPKDRVLSCVYKEIISSSFSALKSSVDISWVSDNKELVEKLKNEFGECPNRL